ncbi:hypothetical protein ASPZODRAFT_170034 [Penicilliopsis zonata CBS 506.65]|uniref:Zn(2)-C6 fungal-type domain-containing protein n=1 Tax=Penicilliopsis zonata CBS 506.65 TaxID=1073090 RepID=A0A1L9S5U3_9EURO|nr:hypothetical protein ASPZODRAFT_170034 [Penicilliopsis zonata CBS 506.65]OJJ42534.1 hypothetical protein ASPZODRAFT_170034 [Penicilliopsis zonata CBS 506.65]
MSFKSLGNTSYFRQDTMYSKTGCRTCKIRKVKCDEGYPACHRCVSTGRACDGYAVWGGDLPQSMSAPCLAISTVEKQCLDWLQMRTVTKLPGSFRSEFWSRLLLQASRHEPAILHASLALSAVHKTVVDGEARMDRFVLRHYNMAISHLNGHFAANDTFSIQVILIACIAFVTLECLRGNFVAAQTHIQNGLKIIEAQKYKQDSLADDWIMEVFSRLEIQVRLLNSLSTSSPRHSFDIPRRFRSRKDAWKSLDSLTNNTLRLRSKPVGSSGQTLIARQTILRRLRRWQTVYEASAIFHGISSEVDEVAPTLLMAHHTMATIMAELCLCSDEMAFDSQNHRFAQLMDELQRLDDIGKANPDALSPGPQKGRSIMDLGYLVPLYYVAVKCRVHVIRHQALGILDSVSHQEGIWDPKTTALVSRKIVELEEQDFYHQPHERCLPASHRIGDIKVLRERDPTEKIFLIASERSVAEYDVTLYIDVIAHCYSIHISCELDIISASPYKY